MQVPEIRSFRTEDLEALRSVCLATGDAGADASHLYRSKTVLSEIYAEPYAAFEPQSVFVVETAMGVSGYILGTGETVRFEARLEKEWWPRLRKLYPDPGPERSSAMSADERMHWLIHHPPRTPANVALAFPAHLDINLMPDLRGTGLGRALMERWLAAMKERGACGAHLQVGIRNQRAVKFYRNLGFHEIAWPGAAPGVLAFGFFL